MSRLNYGPEDLDNRKCGCGKAMKMVSREDDSYGYGATLWFWCSRCGSFAERSLNKADGKHHDHKREIPKALKKLNKWIWCDPLPTPEHTKVRKLLDKIFGRK